MPKSDATRRRGGSAPTANGRRGSPLTGLVVRAPGSETRRDDPTARAISAMGEEWANEVRDVREVAWRLDKPLAFVRPYLVDLFEEGAIDLGLDAGLLCFLPGEPCRRPKSWSCASAPPDAGKPNGTKAARSAGGKTRGGRSSTSTRGTRKKTAEEVVPER